MNDNRQLRFYLAWPIIGVFAFVFTLLFTSCGDNSELDSAELRMRQDAINAAFEKGQKAIEEQSEKVLRWFYDYKMKTEDAADDLTGYGMKWTILTGSEEEIQTKSKQIITNHLFTEAQAQKFIIASFAKSLVDIQNIEDELALKVGMPCTATAKQKDGNLRLSTPQNTQEIDEEMVNALYAELAALVGGEIAAQIATRLAVSGGILTVGGTFSTVSMGISAAVAILVDIAVGWLMDSSGKIKDMLDKNLEENGNEAKKKFTETMNSVLKARRAEWEKQLLHY